MVVPVKVEIFKEGDLFVAVSPELRCNSGCVRLISLWLTSEPW